MSVYTALTVPTVPAPHPRQRAGSLRQTLGHRWHLLNLCWRNALARLARPLQA